MPPKTNLCYEFGGFVLMPDDKLLLHLNKPVLLTGKDFEILCYLVMHPNSLIRTAELVEAVWGSGVSLRDGNITNHIAKIRRAVGCNPRNPRFIKTIYGKEGYRFIAPVRESLSDLSPEFPPTSSSTAGLAITFHLFVPVFLGPKAYERIKTTPIKRTRMDYKVFQIESGRLCILPNGFAVWHLTDAIKFPDLRAVALRRRERYEEILRRKTVVSECTKELVDLKGDRDTPFYHFIGRLGYVFSVLTMSRLSRVKPNIVRNMLRILSCPTLLESKRQSNDDGQSFETLEVAFLEEGISNPDIQEFGLLGRDMGFASWNGVSYCNLADESPDLLEEITEFELYLQATWWQCKCLSDILLSANDIDKERLRPTVQDVTIQYARLKNIAANETASQRTMSEAILETSRVGLLVEETLNLYNQL